MSSNLGFIPFQYQGLYFHKPLQLHKFPPIHSAIDRHKRRNRVGLGRRKLLIKSMKAVIQRVASASVEVGQKYFTHSTYCHICLIFGCWYAQGVVLQVEGRTVSAIGPGLLVLVGLHESDVESDAEYMYVSFSEWFLPFNGYLVLKFWLVRLFRWVADVAKCWTWDCIPMRNLGKLGTKM